MSKHIIRLARGKLGFLDPVNNINLFYPHRMFAEVPVGADLRYIIRALRSGLIVDVNGTLEAGMQSAVEQDVAQPVGREAVQEVVQEPELEALMEEPTAEPKAEVISAESDPVVVEEIALPGGNISVTDQPDDGDDTDGQNTEVESVPRKKRKY